MKRKESEIIEMKEQWKRIIMLRPHHLDNFVQYYYFGKFLDKDSLKEQKYDENMYDNVKDLFDYMIQNKKSKTKVEIAETTDSICAMCNMPQPFEFCFTPDHENSTPMHGHMAVLKATKLKINGVYSIKTFFKKVDECYWAEPFKEN